MERDELLKSIVKGAEFIESIDRNHKLWKSANDKYDRLCTDLMRMDGR